jgi:hypothetical protein
MSDLQEPAGVETRAHDSAAMERLRIKTITDLGKRHAIDDATVRGWVDAESFTTDDAARAEVARLLALATGPKINDEVE